MESHTIIQSPAENSHPSYKFNVQVIGPEKSGKSNLVLRFADDVYCDPLTNMDTNWKVKLLTMETYNVQLRIWDIAPSIFRTSNVDAVLVTVDMTNSKALDELKTYLHQLDRYYPDNVIKIVVATKYCEDDIAVNSKDLLTLCKEWKVPVTCVDAKNNYNVQELFHGCATLLAKRDFIKNASLAQHWDALVKRNTIITDNFLSAFTNFKHTTKRYRCLTFLQGAYQVDSPFNKFPKEILKIILDFVPSWKNENPFSFSDRIFCEMLQIQTMRFAHDYTNTSRIIESESSRSFVHKVTGLCGKLPDSSTEENIKQSIVGFVKDKVEKGESDSKTIQLLVRHGLYKDNKILNNDQPKKDPEYRQNCSIS